jgi:hypothetical protein
VSAVVPLRQSRCIRQWGCLCRRQERSQSTERLVHLKEMPCLLNPDRTSHLNHCIKFPRCQKFHGNIILVLSLFWELKLINQNILFSIASLLNCVFELQWHNVRLCVTQLLHVWRYVSSFNTLEARVRAIISSPKRLGDREESFQCFRRQIIGKVLCFRWCKCNFGKGFYATTLFTIVLLFKLCRTQFLSHIRAAGCLQMLPNANENKGSGRRAKTFLFISQSLFCRECFPDWESVKGFSPEPT